MEFKNVPDPIPCYFLLENSAKSKPTPVTVPFSEDLVPGYDLCTHPTPFLSIGARRSSPPPSPAAKFSSLLTVPTLSQDDPEVPAIIPPRRPLSCSSSTSSSSTLQSRGGDDTASTVIPDIGIGDDGPGQRLLVPVPDISVTAASTNSSPIHREAGELTQPGRRGLTKVLLKGRSLDEIGNFSDRSVTPESPFLSLPPVTLSQPQSPIETTSKKPDLTSSAIPEGSSFSLRCPITSHLGKSSLQEIRRERSDCDSLSTMSPLREEAAEDSLYSSFEGSEMSDQEGEEKRRQRRKEERHYFKSWREMRRKGETVQPRLLTVGGGGLRVELEEDGGGEEGSDCAEDTPDNSPARKISDCSNRSVDSGTKMSEVSKDDDDYIHRKLSDLSEASQNDFEVEEEEGRRGREVRRKSESPVPTSPSLPVHPPLKRSGAIHNKIDFFNSWIQAHTRPSGRRKSGKRWQLLRTQSAVEFAAPPAPNRPRRGSLLPLLQDDT